MSLHPCARCRRHVAVGDRTCPFCGTTQVTHVVHAMVPVAGRISRAAVFVGLGACWTGNAAPTVTDTTPHVVAADAQAPAPASGVAVFGVVTDGVAALPRARVELRDANGRIAATNTDERGAYRIEGIAAGDYQVVVQYGGGDVAGSGQQPITVRDVDAKLDLAIKVYQRAPVAKPYGAPPARRRNV